jgi:hypothetical protein
MVQDHLLAISLTPQHPFGGLVGVYVTVPNTINVLNMLDCACLAPRPQNRPAEPCSATGYKAPPAAACNDALSRTLQALGRFA